MLNLIIIVLVLLIIFALFLLESEIGFLGLIKSLLIIIIAASAGWGISYCMSKIDNQSSQDVDNLIKKDSPKEKWGGIGLSKLCNINKSNDDEFLKIATDRDTDVRAFHEGNEKVYGNLKNDPSGDASIARLSQIHAEKNKKAIINRSRYTVDSLKKYFEDELQANENKAWWDNDELDAYT